MEKYVLCSDDNIILEHEEDSNNFTLKMDVKEKFSNIKELYAENNFFPLIKELNDDIIKDYKQTNNDVAYYIVFTIKTPNETIFKKEFNNSLYLHLNYTNHISRNLVILKTHNANTNNLNDRDNVYLKNINVQVKPCNNGTNICVDFSLDRDQIVNKFLALYVKRLFSKAKLYFDM